MAAHIAMREVPFVSVVIATRNRAATLSACLETVLTLDHPKDRYEVLVVNAASIDDTRTRVIALAECTDAPHVRYVRMPRGDANTARNAGIGAAKGDLVAFVDDDVLLPSGWIGAVAAGAIRWPHADCFGGPVRPLFVGRVPPTCAEHELAGTRFDEGDADKEVREVWGGNMVLRRGALERVGLLREGLPIQQEWEWQQRLLAAGGRIVYLTDAWLWHRRRHTDLRFAPMLLEFFRRGYVKGALGPPVIAQVVIRKAAASLLHAARARCTRGLTESFRQLGLLCGALVAAIASRCPITASASSAARTGRPLMRARVTRGDGG